MDSLLVDPEFMNNIYKFSPELLSNFSINPNGEIIFDTLNDPFQTLSFDDQVSAEEVPDFPDACLKFISDILLEEDLDSNPTPSPLEFIALEATEKSLYDALGLGESYSPSSLDQKSQTSDEKFIAGVWEDPDIGSPDDSSSSKSFTSSTIDSNLSLKSFPALDEISESLVELSSRSSRRKKKSRERDSEGETVGSKGGRSHKVQASFNDEYIEMEEYDDVLLQCSNNTENEQDGNSCLTVEKSSEISRSQRSRGNKKKNNRSTDDQVDLTTLLTQCANAVSSFDLRGAHALLKQIRQHATQYGDSSQRVAHHVANALEARLAGTGFTISADLVDAKFTASEFLKAYRLYVSAIPFKRMSFYLANMAIANLSETAEQIHIIDFGIFLGLQWPCLIQHLSKRPNGPPKIRITGIDYPQQGFRPAHRVQATGQRLAGYCQRFGVPFEYHGIADKWENIKPEDLKIEKGEVVIVNSMYRSGTLLDESVVVDAKNPRDSFLGLVQKLNPTLFIHGVINGTFNAPFFVTRFREALFHYSSVFDVFEETFPREAHERLLIESEIYGKELFNVVACEGAERVQRPESYKQWKVRSVRAGLRQKKLDRETLGKAKEMVKANYHKDFMVDEDRNWMLQGWKGRIFCALSFWQSD